MSPLKKGQKLTDNPKNVRLDLRLTKAEAEDLQYCADNLKTSRTDVINMGIRKVKEEINTNDRVPTLDKLHALFNTATKRG